MSEYLWKKQEAAAERSNDTEQMKKVLVLYTGGTIGMKWTRNDGYVIEQNYLEQKVKTFPGLCDQDYEVDLQRDWVDMGDFKPIPLPCTFEGYRILYTILEYSPLQDSCNLSMEDWGRIGRDVLKYYQHFNGFVILHGTDTMAYTASALSFMFENLGKTVILSGSQVPVSELRNDARDNILGSLVMAGQYVIPEVCIFFHKKLYRGCRATKMASGDFEAFGSPNLPPLATVGSDIIVEWDAIHRPVETSRFAVHSEMDRNVGILRIFPGITRATIRSFLQAPMEGVVLQTYGAGNVPDTSSQSYIFLELKEACDRGVVVVNCTQCNRGLVKEKYAAGIKLREIGVVPGADMTAEAALTKLSYLLARDYSRDKIKELLSINLRGELTVLDPIKQNLSLKSSAFLREVASTLNISSSKEVKRLKEALFPPLMNAAAANGDIQCLEDLKHQGGDFNIPDYDGRTPLHLACCEGHLDAVRYLLENGASVHVTDRYHQTPLDNAEKFGKDKVVELLLMTGAETSGTEKNGVEMHGSIPRENHL